MQGSSIPFLVGATLGLLGAQATLAWACSCELAVSETRTFVVAAVTQLSGDGDVAADELRRWSGVMELTGNGGPDMDRLRIWIRDERSDECVRNVWIDTEVASPLPEDAAGQAPLPGEGAR